MSKLHRPYGRLQYATSPKREYPNTFKRIYDVWIELFGFDIHIRIEPKEFTNDMKQLSNLLDDRKFFEFDKLLADMDRKWGANDPEMVRISHLGGFTKGE